MKNNSHLTLCQRFHQIPPNLFLFIVLACLMLVGYYDAYADDSDFVTYQGSCETCYVYFDNEPRIWDGDIEVYFNPEGSSLSPEDVETSIMRAILLINIYANVPITYVGRTTLTPQDEYVASRDGVVLVSSGDVGYFNGFARLWWNWQNQDRVNYSEITLSSSLSYNCLDGTVLHEVLHSLNVDHSDDVNAIMYATPYHPCEYQATLRRDDILALQELYPARPNMQGVITSFEDNIVCGYQPEITYGNATATEIETCTHTDNISIRTIEFH